MSTFRILRTETISYWAHLDREQVELIVGPNAADAGINLRALTDEELRDELASDIDDYSVYSALIEATEPNSDVDGSTFDIVLVEDE